MRAMVGLDRGPSKPLPAEQRLFVASPARGMDARAILALQRTAGNRAVAGMLQRMTYAIKHPEERGPSFNDIVGDAEAHGDRPIVKSPEEFLQRRNQAGAKLHIFAHGNQDDVGGMDPDALAKHLIEDCGMPKTVRRITLHACMSGLPDPRSYRATFGRTYAERLHKALYTRYRHLVVKGQRGLAFTDSEGRTRVLKAGETEEGYKRARDRAATQAERRRIEQQYLEKSTATHDSLQEWLVARGHGGTEAELQYEARAILMDPDRLDTISDEIAAYEEWQAAQTADEPVQVDGDWGTVRTALGDAVMHAITK